MTFQAPHISSFNSNKKIFVQEFIMWARHHEEAERTEVQSSALSTNDIEKLLSEATYGIDREAYRNIQGEIREGFQKEAEIKRKGKWDSNQQK